MTEVTKIADVQSKLIRNEDSILIIISEQRSIQLKTQCL